MLRKPQRHRMVTDINITPFTDVILVLLIIFMLTTPIIYQLNVKVNLPNTKNSEPTSHVEPVTINIVVSADGQVYFNNNPVSTVQLEQKIKETRKYAKDIQVFLYSDKSVQFEYVISVLDILMKWNITDLHIASLKV